MFWRLTMYLKFTPKMNDICAEKVLSYLHLKERAVSTLRPVKVEFWKICKRVTFWGRQKESIYANTFLSFTVEYMFGRSFYAIWEFYREEEAFCLGRTACFGLLNISRLFRKLCQCQAHTVNHQPTKCRTADFYNRRNGTSWESGTFPIKKNKNKKHVFRRSFLKDGQTTNSCHSQHNVSFVIRTLKNFNLFRSWLCFALCIFSQ